MFTVLYPFDSETAQLLVARALAPASPTALALPGSQMLKRMSGSLGTCSLRNSWLLHLACHFFS